MWLTSAPRVHPSLVMTKIDTPANPTKSISPQPKLQLPPKPTLMGLDIHTFKSLTGAWTSAARRCDSCKTAAAAAFCKTDLAFLCLICDSKIHGTDNKTTRHARVWMCEVCEQAPAAVTCKADAAALCVTCDNDIHSANPLARRHDRVPVEPFFDSSDAIVKSSPFNFLVPGENGQFEHNQHDDVAGASWLLPNPPDLNPKLGTENQQQQHQEMKGSGELFFPEMDPFLEFEYQNSLHQDRSGGNDSVVPVQVNKPSIPNSIMNNNNRENCFEIDFCRSKLTSFNYPSQSISHSVSSSSLDVGVVPDGSSMSDISYSFGQNMSGSTDPTGTMPGSTGSQATQLIGIDREARVLRYREKRKNRKFEKTIRYASRKAYAETRPRIKGRFAKRTEIDSDMESLYNSASMAFMDNQYGVVPSF